jgi:hypothetical protein
MTVTAKIRGNKMLEIVAVFFFLSYMIFPVTVFTHLFGGALPMKITQRRNMYCED